MTKKNENKNIKIELIVSLRKFWKHLFIHSEDLKAVCEWSDKVLHLSRHFNLEVEAEDIKLILKMRDHWSQWRNKSSLKENWYLFTLEK